MRKPPVDAGGFPCSLCRENHALSYSYGSLPARAVNRDDAMLHQCAKCGFVGLRHLDTREICEVESEIRETGEVPAKPGLSQYVYVLRPICFMQQHPLQNECIEAGDSKKALLQVITAERSCDEFTPWKQGLSPREHREMLDRKWMLEQQTQRDEAQRSWLERQAERDHEWRVQQDERDRRWREEQASKADQREQDRDKQDRQWRREDRRTSLVTLASGMLIGILGVVGSLIAAGKLPWFRDFDEPPAKDVRIIDKQP